CSNATTFGPRINLPDSSTSWMRSRMRGIRRSYCARTSTRGTGTASQCSRAPAHDQVGKQREHTRDDRIFGVAEVVVEAVVASPERPAGRGDPEAPRHAAYER